MLLFECHAYFNQSSIARPYAEGDRVLLARVDEPFRVESYTQENAALELLRASMNLDICLHERSLRVGDVIRVDKKHRAAAEFAYDYKPSIWLAVDPNGLSRLTGTPRLTGRSISPIFC